MAGAHLYTTAVKNVPIGQYIGSIIYQFFPLAASIVQMYNQ